MDPRTRPSPRRPRTPALGAVAAVTAVTALLALTGCGGGASSADASTSPSPSTSTSAASSPSASASTPAPTPKVVDGTITATDKSFALSVPSGWTSAKFGVPAPFVVAVRSPQDPPQEQVLISVFDDPGAAAETAARTAQGLRQQKITCDVATIAGRSLVDCHYADQGTQVRKMLFPFEHDGRSALLLFQTTAGSRKAGYAQVEPLLDSWRWSDGSRLATS